jgi:hypothetical protein
MNYVLQERRSMHQDDNIRRWGYERYDDVSSPASFSPSSDDEIDMRCDDAVDGLFEEYLDDAGVMVSDEDSSPVSDAPSKSASSSSAQSEDEEGYTYEYCEGIYFADERSLF